MQEAIAEQYDLPLVSLPEGYSMIPLDAAHSDAWALRLGISNDSESPSILDCPVTHHFAGALFGEREYVVFETEYFGGSGEQAAAVYQRGTVVLEPTSAQSGPINSALGHLGVAQRGGYDAFDVLGLGSFRSFEDLFLDYLEGHVPASS